MQDRTILKTGIAGSVVAAICCFTPVLAILLATVGLSAWLGWLDYVLLPALAIFIAITAYGVWRRQGKDPMCHEAGSSKPKDQST